MARRPRILWDRGENPTEFVSRNLGIEPWDLRLAIHVIKEAYRLGGCDRIVIYDDGSVTDSKGEHLGNLFDEI